MRTVKSMIDNLARPVVTTNPDATVFAAIQLLSEHNIGSLPVVEGGRLVGILTERDYTRKVVLRGRSSKDTPVRDIMTPNPTCLSADQLVEDCMHLMVAGDFRHLPIVEDGRLVNLVSMKDLVSWAIAEQETILEDTLLAVHEKDELARSIKDMTFEKLLSVNKAYLSPLKEILGELYRTTEGDLKVRVRKLNDEAEIMLRVVDQIARWYFSERALVSKRVLLAETDRRAQIMARTALGGTGVLLDIVSSEADGRQALLDNDYDILCVNSELAGLADVARVKSPDTDLVFLTAEDIRDYLPTLREYPQLSNIVSRNPDDRAFTVRSITTTISKLIHHEIFGLEKYLNWGCEIREHAVVGSEERYALIDQMEAHFQTLGLRRAVTARCATVAEEMLLNAIYDAPRDDGGRPLFDGDRLSQVKLESRQQGVFRYACDGMLAAISVEDPFGAVTRHTILDYLESCYQGQSNFDRTGERGGAGQGIFMIMEMADLTVFNVKKGVRTEVMALFAIDLESRKKFATSSFHYFSIG
jgi:CBS domain-containing protein